jgi:hypothetical protein
MIVTCLRELRRRRRRRGLLVWKMAWIRRRGRGWKEEREGETLHRDKGGVLWGVHLQGGGEWTLRTCWTEKKVRKERCAVYVL